MLECSEVLKNALKVESVSTVEEVAADSFRRSRGLRSPLQSHLSIVKCTKIH